MLIDGIHVPLTIPFARDGALALSKLEGNVRRYSLSPVAALVVLAPDGEAAALSDEEAREVLRAVGRVASETKVLVAGVARESVHSAVEMCCIAEAAGFDVVLLRAPVLTDGERNVFFRSVADGSPLPVMLWSDAVRALPLSLLAELAGHANVLGVYDAALSVARYAEIASATAGVTREVVVTNVFAPATRRMQAANRDESGLVSASSLSGGVAVMAAPAKAAIKMRKKVVGFQVMSAGACSGMLPLLEAGVAGAMSKLAAYAPQASFEIYAAFKDGDPALSALKADRVRAAEPVMEELGVAGVKYACDVNGYGGGLARLPRLAMTAEERDRVDQVLATIPN